ncbi:IS3 family transposase [Paenibacillus sp. KACC 21273]
MKNPKTFEEAKMQIANYLTYYNEEHFQSKLNGLPERTSRRGHFLKRTF